jgi:LysR family transcriptional regulator, carnitine catabolism transcriptional activator
MTGAELRHLKAFLEVARCGSFTRAAEELHICQPALTVQIKQLEHALGVKLFDRDRRHVALTQVGRELIRPIERVLADIESIRVTSEELATHQRGIVTVAALPSIAASVIPGAIRQLTNDHPGIAVRIVELIGTRVSDAVKAGEVDFGIGSHARIDRELTYQHLWSDRMAAFVPARHPLARKRAVTFRELAGYPLILTRRDSSVRVLVDRMLERERISVNVVHEASYVSTLIALVAAGLGISILPEREFTTAIEASVCMLPLRPPALIRNIGIIGSTARSFSPAAEKFADVLRLAAAPPSQSAGELRRNARREAGPNEGATMLRGQRAAR